MTFGTLTIKLTLIAADRDAIKRITVKTIYCITRDDAQSIFAEYKRRNPKLADLLNATWIADAVEL